MRRTQLFVLSLCVALSSPTSFAADDDEAIEEIVVTGSYLKRSAADSPSPLSVITSADIEDIGASDVAEIVQSMPWASGSQTRAATFQGEGADGRNSLNLRNLGQGSTLVLINGKRQAPSWYNGRGNASVNVNSLVPNIALERVEVVKDGASALYGSDAVAGVVNFITRRNFEGFDVQYQYTTDDETKQGDANTMSMIWGVQGDRGGIVASASFLNRDEVHVGDRYDRYGGTTLSSTGQPGRLIPLGGQTITWGANGFDPGNPVAGNALPRDPAGTSFGSADVNCEDSAALEQAGPLGVLFDRCIYDYGPFFAIQAEESLRNMHVAGHYDIADNLEFHFEFAGNNAEFDRLNSLNPNAPALTIPIDHPGTVEDAFRRGIEPVLYSNVTRLIGGTRNTPREWRPIDTFTDSSRSDQRLVVGFTYDFEAGGNAWTLDATYTASESDLAETQAQDTLSGNMELALNGLGGPECDVINGTPGEGNIAWAATGDFGAGSCYYFNPFGSHQFNRDGSIRTVRDPLTNPAELYEWLQGRITRDDEYRQRVIDVVLAGDVFQTDYGPVGLAVGFQQRRDKGKVNFDAAANTGNLDFVFGASDWSGALTTQAFFVEIAVPIADFAELNVAARYEDFDEIGEDTIDPKATLLIRPVEGLTLRASAGSAFRVPSLQQLFGSITTVADQTDVDGGSAFKPSISVGNPNLAPEKADTVNFGFSWVPTDGMFEGLSIDFDYYTYEYTDIITRESSANLLSADNAALNAYRDANLGGSCASDRECWIEAVNLGVGNRDQIIRNGNALLLRILPDFANANSADISGFDVTASYRFDNDWGNWRVGIQGSWVDEYEVDVGGTVIDAVGNYNSRNPVARPLPEFVVNGTLSWSLDQHRVFAIVKHVDELETDVPAGTRGFFGAVAGILAGNTDIQADLVDTKIESMTTVDVQYTYNFGETGFLSNSSISLGARNVFNEEAPAIAVVTAYDPRLHDGLGRVWFARFSASL
ncbi:MAG: TonB-dependent receptor [Pseudomonadota bacterium]